MYPVFQHAARFAYCAPDGFAGPEPVLVDGEEVEPEVPPAPVVPVVLEPELELESLGAVLDVPGAVLLELPGAVLEEPDVP